MRLQIAALFVQNANGHLRFVNEPGYPEAELDPAPRFFMGRTPEGHLWRFRRDLPEPLMSDLERLCRAEPATQNLEAEPESAAAIRAALGEHAQVAEEWRGPAYWVPEDVRAPGHAVLISEENAHLLEAHFPWKLAPRPGFELGPLAAAVAGDSAVSICFCARLTGAAAEAGAETAPGFRGRGHAGAAVALWAAAVRETGRLPLYSTSWQNAASLAVARKLGLRRYGEDWWIR